MLLTEVSYSSIDFSKKILHHKKRTRAGFKDENYHYKLWEYGWEHGNVTRNCFEVGYYDLKMIPAFVSMITHEGKDVGYIMKSGKVMGESRDPWNNLVKYTTQKQQLLFLNQVLQKSVRHNRIISDMVPSNVIIFEDDICLIDLEGVESFDWMFNGKPEPHEAQNRNLNKVSKPYWGIMSQWTKMYMEQCLGIKYDKDLDSPQNIQEAANIISGMVSKL